MAFPVDAARATTDGSTSSTSQSLNLPGSIASGDILIAVVRSPASTTFTWPAGWEEWEESGADASDDVQSIAYRIADGTEGATITVTLGTARVMAGLCYRITGGVGIIFSAIATGSGSQPDSPNLAALTSAADVLWLTIGGCQDELTITNTPTNYANGAIQGITGVSGTSDCSVYGASRQLNAASENPGAWTLSATTTWMAWTVGISEAAFPSRVSQLPVEAVVQPTSGQARVSQLPVEAVIQPTSGAARISQLVVEAVIQPAAATSRFRAFILD